MSIKPAKAPREAKYSLTWARGIYQGLVAKRGRAVAIVNEIWEIPDEEPPRWLAAGSARWLNYRNVIKTWDRWEKSSPLPDPDPEVLHNRIVTFKDYIESSHFKRAFIYDTLTHPNSVGYY